MKCNGLTCRCGQQDKWELSWGYTGTWELCLECDCGAVYMLGKSSNEKVSVSDFVFESNKGGL